MTKIFLKTVLATQEKIKMASDLHPIQVDYSGTDINMSLPYFLGIDDICNTFQLDYKGSLADTSLQIKNENHLHRSTIYLLQYLSAVAKDAEVKKAASIIIIAAAKQLGIQSSSIQNYYETKGEKEPFKTVPASNLRGLTFYNARGLIRSQIDLNEPYYIFELAASERGYTEQKALEFSAMVHAAYISLGYKNTKIYIQADHYQVKASAFNYEEFEKTGSNSEIKKVKDLIKEALEAGYRNIDIDTSTLEKEHPIDAYDKEIWNAKASAVLIKYVRQLEKQGLTNGEVVSVGSEVGEVGTEYTKPEEVKAYFELLMKELGSDVMGPSKMSINTGTAHGGVQDAFGNIVAVRPRLETHHELFEHIVNPWTKSKLVTVQHGASTLGEELFWEMPKNNIGEVHLASAYQYILFDQVLSYYTLLDEKGNVTYDPQSQILNQMRKLLLTEEGPAGAWAASRKKLTKEGVLNVAKHIKSNQKQVFGPLKLDLLNLPYPYLKLFEQAMYDYGMRVIGDLVKPAKDAQGNPNGRRKKEDAPKKKEKLSEDERAD